MGRYTKEQIKKRMDQLYKNPKESVKRIAKRCYSVSDLREAPKGVMISMILECEFGRGYDKILFAPNTKKKVK